MTFFAPAEAPRVFAVPPGADFPAVLVDGLLARHGDGPPEALAQVTVYVTTRRMARRIADILDRGPARLLPRVRLVTDLAQAQPMAPLPLPVPPLRRKLELARLVGALIAADPTLAPGSAVYDLAASLAALMDEMQGEGVPPSALAGLDVSDASGHWARSQKFLTLVASLAGSAAAGDAESRQRRAVEALAEDWARSPPQGPVIVAGSTGSRGTTQLFMEAVARLPQGALVLPGFDDILPPAIWARLIAPAPQQDHPQYRFAALAAELGLSPKEIPPWHAPAAAPAPARNALVSLALRPAPVTDGWRREGPSLGLLPRATEGLSLIEAPDPRAEAGAIALALREAAETGVTAALISPDRILTRRVAAALDRWGITPDDSAGEPLGQTPAGRLLHQAAGLFARPVDTVALLALLKHPLTHAAGGRNTHLLATRDLELHLRRDGPPQPGPEDLRRWGEQAAGAAESAERGDARRHWAGWAAGCLERATPAAGEGEIAGHVARLLALAEDLCRGCDPAAQGADLPLWARNDGLAARSAIEELAAEAAHGGPADGAAFAALLRMVLAGEVRDPVAAHSGVMIWGTLEARVQGAELVILAGLNEGVWPEMPAPDPWLNRKMRADLGLLLPERRIGLSAHDFQQAVGAPRVILSRARRDAESETVPSRWLNRLTNLMEGLPDQEGPEALAGMRARGQAWVDLAGALDSPAAPVAPATRPAPRPPVSARPPRLSVTEIETLVRDPFEIYAKRVLRLSPLDPLRLEPDARIRGQVMHLVLDRFVKAWASYDDATRRQAFLATTKAVLESGVPWPTARRLWLARFARIADHFLTEEAGRLTFATPEAFECRGRLDLAVPAMPEGTFRLTARADRIDLTPEGGIVLYDYKTGQPPSAREQASFSKQLLLEATMAEAGGFEGLAPGTVVHAAYIGLGTTPRTMPAPLVDMPVARIRAELTALIAAFAVRDRGYVAQAARRSDRSAGDYDHLSRIGEWSLSDPALPQDVGG